MLVARRNQDLMPSLFNELLDWNNWNNGLWNETHHTTPKMNVSETDKNYELELCVPGLKKEDLNISIDPDNNLVVEMVQEEKSDDKQKDNNRKYLRHEFSRMQFKQMMTLPDNVKKDDIKARVNDGILYIELPKITEQEKKSLSQTIQIN